MVLATADPLTLRVAPVISTATSDGDYDASSSEEGNDNDGDGDGGEEENPGNGNCNIQGQVGRGVVAMESKDADKPKGAHHGRSGRSSEQARWISGVLQSSRPLGWNCRFVAWALCTVRPFFVSLLGFEVHLHVRASASAGFWFWSWGVGVGCVSFSPPLFFMRRP